MPELEHGQSLSFGDALFLYLEREGMPLHIASISVFEGSIPLRDFTRFIEFKLPLVPRYRQRVFTPPLNIGLPCWQYDPDFNVANHIREIALKRGSEGDFQAVAARLLSLTMDRTRPLWDLTLIRGLEGHRTGLVTRVHHCLADGLAGIGLMNALMDPSPIPPRLPRRKPRYASASQGRDMPLVDSFITATFSAVQRVLTAHSELLAMAGRIVSAGAGNGDLQGKARHDRNSSPPLSFADHLTRLMPELAAPAERLPFNVICRGPQKFNWVQVPMSDIVAIKQACDAKFNDVALAAMTLAVRRYAELHGVSTAGRVLRVVVPVSVRTENEMRELGNHITFLPVTVPMDIRNPRHLIAAVRDKMQVLKSAHVAELVGFAGTLLGATPIPLQALLGPIASPLPLSVCNLIFTNVRGPSEPLYLLGHKMLACYPYVPIGGEMGMNCAVLTYNGTAYFGFTGDVNAVPDLKRCEKFLASAFKELRKAVVLQRREHRVQAKDKPLASRVASASPQDEPPPPKPLARAAVA